MHEHGEDVSVDGFACLLPFDTDDPEFARGFEAGRVWAELNARPDEAVEQVAHISNAEMFLRIGEALGRPVQSEELDDCWLTLFFDPCGVVEAQ